MFPLVEVLLMVMLRSQATLLLVDPVLLTLLLLQTLRLLVASLFKITSLLPEQLVVQQ